MSFQTTTPMLPAAEPIGWSRGSARPARGEGEVLFIASGRKLAQVREAAERLHRDGVGSRILNVTSYELAGLGRFRERS